MSAYQKFREVRFFGSLDGLRALSILAVIWIHTWFGTPQYEWLRKIPILRSGEFGVEVFFTISGFLITTLLLRERDKYSTISLKDFYIRRSLRIWPLYYAVLGLYVVLVLLTEHGTERGRLFFHCLPSYLTYTYTWFAPWDRGQGAIFNFAWSLSTEEQFYVFWPFVAKYFRCGWPVLVMSLVIAARVLWQFGFLNSLLSPNSLPNRIMSSISIPICMGAVLAFAVHYRRTYDVLYRVLGSKATAPIAFVALLISVIWKESNGIVLSWICLPIFIGSCVVREDHGLAKLLRWKPLAFIGVISYGMYLYNTLAVKFLRPALAHARIQHPAMAYPFVLGLTILIAWLSFKFFESPFLGLKQKFSRLHPPPSKAAPVMVNSPELHAQVHP